MFLLICTLSYHISGSSQVPPDKSFNNFTPSPGSGINKKVQNSVPWEGPLPWRENRRYKTTSRYEIHLEGINLEIAVPNKKDAHFRNEKPFSGYYQSTVEYTTEGCTNETKKQGSVYRFYKDPNIRFVPADSYARGMIFKYRPDWVEKAVNCDPSTFSGKAKRLYAIAIAKAWYDWGKTVQDVAPEELSIGFEKAQFFFREIVEGFDDNNVYLLRWDSPSDMISENTSEGLTISSLPSTIFESQTNDKERRRYLKMQGSQPSENVRSSITAESKLLAHTLFGQEKIRAVGDCWYITPKKLESFLPSDLNADKSRPFNFEGNYLVLKATSDSNNNKLIVTACASGIINDMNLTTDLIIRPNISTKQPTDFKRPDLFDAENNWIRFVVDSNYQIVEKVDIQMKLLNYSGAIPESTKLPLTGAVGQNGDFKVTGKLEGIVTLKVDMKTEISRQE